VPPSEGRLVGIAKQKCLVLVEFSSAKPLAFSTKIEMIDAEGFRFPLSISVTADASVLTTQPYLTGAHAAHLKMEALPPPVSNKERPGPGEPTCISTVDSYTKSKQAHIHIFAYTYTTPHLKMEALPPPVSNKERPGPGEPTCISTRNTQHPHTYTTDDLYTKGTRAHTQKKLMTHIFAYTYMTPHVKIEALPPPVSNKERPCPGEPTYICAYTHIYIHIYERGPQDGGAPPSGIGVHGEACRNTPYEYIHIYIYIYIHTYTYIHI